MQDDSFENNEPLYQEEALTLHPGGRLEFRWLEEENGGQVADVTEDASIFLFSPLRLGDDLRLGDVFLLLRANPDVAHLYAHDGVKDLLEEVFGGEAPPYSGDYDPMGIEYLELSANWQIETKKKTARGHTTVVRNEIRGYLPRLDFNGIGFPLREEDIPSHGHTIGQRITWGLELMPPRALFNTPLRLKRAVTVHEHIQHSLKRHENLTHQYSYRADWPLGLILHAIVETFHTFGDKNERAAMRQMLTERFAEFAADGRKEQPQQPKEE